MLLHELEVASSRAGGPLLTEDKAHFVFDPKDKDHLRHVKSAVLPNRRVRALIRRYAPSLRISRGRVPVRLVALSVVLQAVERHRFNVVKVAGILIGAQLAAGLASEIVSGHTKHLFNAPFAPVLPVVWIVTYVAYFVFATYLLSYVLLGVNDIRRRYFALKLLNRMVRPTLRVRRALRGLGVDSRLHSTILEGSASATASSTTSASASSASFLVAGEEGALAARPRPIDGGVASGMRAGALFADWQDADAAVWAEDHAATMALGPGEEAGEGMGDALLDDNSDNPPSGGSEGDGGDAGEQWALGQRTLSVTGLDQSLRAPPPPPGESVGVYGPGASRGHGPASPGDVEAAAATARERTIEEEEDDEGRGGRLTAGALAALQQSLREPAPGDETVSQPVGASELPQPGLWERAVSRLGVSGEAAAAGRSAHRPQHAAWSGYVAMEEEEGEEGRRPRWRSASGEDRAPNVEEGSGRHGRLLSHDTANVPTVSLSRPVLSLHVSQNVHAYLWCRQVAKNFGMQFKRRLEFDMSFTVILLLGMIAWFASGLVQVASNSDVEPNQTVLVATPILVAILGVAISLMVRDGIKINNMALVAKDSLMRQEEMARSYWRELSARRQACVTRHLINQAPEDEAGARAPSAPPSCAQNEANRTCNAFFSAGQAPAGAAARSDLAVAWAARRVCDTAEALSTAATWVVLENEQNPIRLFGIRVNNTLLRSLYTLALSSVSIGARYLVVLYQARE